MAATDIHQSIIRRALAAPDVPDAGARMLVEICGTVEALETLNDDPLPVDDVDHTSIPAVDVDLVNDLLDLIEPVATHQLDEEYVTVLRRLVAYAVHHPSRPLRRRASRPRLAAALVWVALKANDDLGRRHRWSGADVWWWFGVSDCGALARRIADVLGLLRPDLYPYHGWGGDSPVYAGDVALLHARARRELVIHRHRTIDTLERMAAQREAQRKVVHHPGGRIELRARESRPLGVLKDLSRDGRATVVVLLGDSPDDPDDVLGFSVPDARDLLHSLQRALDAPLAAV